MDMKFDRFFNTKNAATFAAFCFIGFTPALQAQIAPEVGTVSAPRGDAYAAAQRNTSQMARVTFYRPATGVAAGVARLEINGRYHASLQYDSYTDVCLDPVSIQLGAQMVKIGEDIADNNDAVATLEPKSNQDLFVRLTESRTGQAMITTVSPEVARAELKNTRRQIHAASRLTQSRACFAPVAPTVAQAPENVENLSFVADGLFAFGRGDLASLSSKGRHEMDQLIAYLQRAYGKHDAARVLISGHADPLGNAQANQRLSEMRAQTIRTYMMRGGMDGKRIASEGFGDTQLVIKNCGLTATEEVISCNRPNRRVMVNVQLSSR
jgi:OOP family OmpA-OmpF porin